MKSTASMRRFYCSMVLNPAVLTTDCQTLKATVLQWTGLPVCVGIASTKTLAKIANHCAKKRPEYQGVCNFNDMPLEQLNVIFQSLPVGELWGIGSRSTAKLNQLARGVPQNDAAVVNWFRKAADQGYAHAQIALGSHYRNGYGGSTDYSAALFWYRKAANQGDTSAQSSLAFMRPGPTLTSSQIL